MLNFNELYVMSIIPLRFTVLKVGCKTLQIQSHVIWLFDFNTPKDKNVNILGFNTRVTKVPHRYALNLSYTRKF